MKLHELDWGEALAQLLRWEALPSPGRRAFLAIRPGPKVPSQALGDGATQLVEAGFLHPPGPRGTLYVVDPAVRGLLVALRAATRLRPLGGGGVLPVEYAQEQLTTRQAHLLANPGGGYLSLKDRHLAVERASSVDWVRRFLEAAKAGRAGEWEGARLPSEEAPWLSPGAAATLAALIEALAEHPRGVLLGELPRLLPPDHAAAIPAALAAGLRYLLVFVSAAPGSLEVRAGLLPEVARRLGPPPPPPVPVEAAERFHLAYRIADMTALLVEAAAEPLPVRTNDAAIFARSRSAVAARLARRPAWAVPFLAAAEESEGEDAESLDRRVVLAADSLAALRLAAVKPGGDRLRFAPTRAGRAWLAGGEGERTRAVLDRFRAARDRVPLQWAGRDDVDFFGIRLAFSVDAKKLDLRAALQDAFLSVPEDALLPVREFVVHHAECRNPFLGPDGPVPAMRHGWGRPQTREGWEAAWAGTLAGFLRARLVPFGGAQLGRSAEGRTLFGVTAAGRYLLGGSDELVLEEAAAEVVVQPDFEVVFLAPAPAAEAELARFAERTGSGVGALFRITRASVVRAAEAGMGAETLLQALAALSRTGVPDNVGAQVRGWMAATRRVRMAPALLVECPDEETAARVGALGGRAVSRVSDALLRVDGDRKTVNALVKKLRSNGIFVEGG